MMITVLVCTYNRWESLKKTLEGFLGQKTPESLEWEIFVIDNNSSDRTREITESYIPRFQGRLKYFFEPRQGKPYAINLGIQEARGEIIAFTDDDCVPAEDFVSAIDSVFAACDPKISFIGGKILPDWGEVTQPEWMTGDLLGPLAMLDYGDKEFVVDQQEAVAKKHIFYGANFAFRREVFARHGGFDVTKTFAQDTEICLRLLKAGETALYAPSVRVFHYVPPERVTPGYLYRWYYRRGKFREKTDGLEPKWYHPFGIPYWMWMKIIFLMGKSLTASTAEWRIRFRCESLFYLGQTVKLFREAMRSGN